MAQSELVLGRPASTRAGLAVFLMLVGMFLFSANDVLGKWLVGTYSPPQILLIRSLAALAILLPLLMRDGIGDLVRVQRPGVHALRAMLSTLDVTCFYVAVIFLPLADVMAFYMAAPIFVAALSPILLGEKVGWRRWSAIVVGFVGVLIALNPAATRLEIGALMSLAGSFAFALMVLATRALGAAGDKVLVTWQTVGALLVGLAAGPFLWTPVSGPDYFLMALLGIVSMGAHLCVTRSLKLAPAATVAPYQYTLIVWAILLGYPVFGDVPSAHMLAGAGIIVAAGLFIFWREQVMKRRGHAVVKS